MIIRNGWHFPDSDQHFKRDRGIYPESNYQQQSIDAAYNYVKNFDSVIDVGANIGLHTVRFSKKFKTVHAFEPVKENYQCLEKNVLGLQNVNLYKLGLGDKIETTDISIPAEHNNCGAYSLVDFKEGTNLIKESIEIKKLDDFNLNVDFIKVDIQGFESKFLLGSIETIKNYKPVIMLEAEGKKSYNSINSILEPLNYYCVESIRHDKIWITRG